MEKIKRTLSFIFQHPLAGKHPFRALCRFAWWQLQSSVAPRRFINKPFIADVQFRARKGLTGITGNIYTGLHEFNDMAFLLHFLLPADTFFDVGANAGSYTLLASGVCKATTVAFEAFSGTAAILQQNIELNRLQSKTTVVNAAAGAQNGSIAFSTNGDTTNHVLSDDESGSSDIATVPMITVDSVNTRLPPVLIKIDVEGFETEVLRGMATTLKHNELKAIIIELNGSGGRYGFDEREIHQKLGDHGFRPYQYNPFTRGLTLMDTFGAYNTLYCRDIDFVIHRVKTAKPFTIMGETI